MANVKDKKETFKDNGKESKNDFKKKRSTGKKQYKAKDFTKSEDRDKKQYLGNDFEWYNRNPKLINDAASISWFMPTGLPYHVVPTSTEFSNGWDLNIGGIATFRHVISVGWSADAQSAMNVAGRNIYAYVRYHNSGHTNYDYPDLSLMLWAVAELYAYIAYLKRVYGCMMVTSAVNRYLPKDLIRAMNLDYDDLHKHLPQLRWYINSLVLKAASLCVPNVFNYYKRVDWIYSNIFIDNPSVKSQLYVIIPHGYRVYNEKTSESGGFLEFHERSYLPETFDDLVTIGDTMVNALLESEDIGIMSGDIKKAFDGKLWAVSGIDPDYFVIPFEDVQVLEQIKNSTLVGDITDLDVTQDVDSNILEFKPKMTAELTAGSYKANFDERKILTTIDPNPGVQCTTEITRMTALHDTSGNYRCIGADILVSANIWRREVDPEDPTKTILRGNALISRMNEYDIRSGHGVKYYPQFATEMFHTLFLRSNFRFFPDFWIQVIVADGYADYVAPDAGPTMYQFMDLDNYTLIHQDTLTRLHDTALMSLFNVPEIGTI